MCSLNDVFMKTYCTPRRLSVTCQEIQSQDSRKLSNVFQSHECPGHDAVRGSPGRASGLPELRKCSWEFREAKAAGVCQAEFREAQRKGAQMCRGFPLSLYSRGRRMWRKYPRKGKDPKGRTIPRAATGLRGLHNVLNTVGNPGTHAASGRILRSLLPS